MLLAIEDEYAQKIVIEYAAADFSEAAINGIVLSSDDKIILHNQSVSLAKEYNFFKGNAK